MSRSLKNKLRTSQQTLGKLLCRHSFVARHGTPTISAKKFWRKGGWTVAYLPDGYQLVVSRAGVLYLIACHVAMPVKARNQRVLLSMRQAYAYLL